MTLYEHVPTPSLPLLYDLLHRPAPARASIQSVPIDHEALDVLHAAIGTWLIRCV